ncbi:type IV pilin protein [Oleiagrimonas sp. C23AA]|nr:type IV pilin protein [Oleiagrimonas sp. C23AA]
MRKQAGFSLIELMIVVAIVAILASIAWPSYRRYVVRSHRTDAKKALLEVAGREERYFYSNNDYTDQLSELGSSSSAAGQYYSLSIPVANATTYTVKATAVGSQQRDDELCQSISLDKTGKFTSEGSTTDAPNCWGGG